MVTSVFFNNFQSSQEQELIEDLVIESIRIYGIDLWYIPRALENYDSILGEDAISEYNDACMIEMYIRNVSQFGGNGDFMAKFGVQIDDSITFTVAKRTFQLDIADPLNLPRPQEGDLIYFPLNKKMFIVKFVEHEAIFYQMGSLQTYDLKCDLWEYSNEKIQTGVPEIDAFQKNFSFAMNQMEIISTDGFVITDTDNFPIIQAEFNFTQQVGPALTNNQDFDIQNNGVINFTEDNPFGDIK